MNRFNDELKILNELLIKTFYKPEVFDPHTMKLTTTQLANTVHNRIYHLIHPYLPTIDWSIGFSLSE